MKKYRSKRQTEYLYGTLYTVMISCAPQSRWTRLYKAGSNHVFLENKNVIIEISVKDF